MRTLAILPVKTFGAAKQRLAAALRPAMRSALARAMFRDVLASLRGVPRLDVVVVTAEPAAVAVARTAAVPVLPDTARAGQSAAASIGISHALAAGYERVLLVPGDAPLLEPGEIAALLDAQRAVTIVPDRHGTGTNGLVLAPPDAIVPTFGPGSRDRHVAAAQAAGLEYAVVPLPSLVLDVDTGADLAALHDALASDRGGAAATRAVLAGPGGRAGGVEGLSSLSSRGSAA
jgi:2-phospho-L-lactate/phosphoenolpyruvate guanylyltransferase